MTYTCFWKRQRKSDVCQNVFGRIAAIFPHSAKFLSGCDDLISLQKVLHFLKNRRIYLNNILSNVILCLRIYFCFEKRYARARKNLRARAFGHKLKENCSNAPLFYPFGRFSSASAVKPRRRSNPSAAPFTCDFYDLPSGIPKSYPTTNPLTLFNPFVTSCRLNPGSIGSFLFLYRSVIFSP